MRAGEVRGHHGGDHQAVGAAGGGGGVPGRDVPRGVDVTSSELQGTGAPARVLRLRRPRLVPLLGAGDYPRVGETPDIAP